MSSSNYTHLDFEKVVKVTDKALLVRFTDGTESWLPFSQVADSDDYEEGDGPGTISITDWLANERGL